MQYRKHAILIVCFLPWTLFSAVASDREKPLQLLVETLEASTSPSVQAALLKGMLSGLEGRRDVQIPDSWPALSSKLAASGNPLVRQRALALSQVFGDQAASEKALADVSDRTLEPERRRAMLNALLDQKNQAASELLQKLLDEPEMRLAAIRGYAIIENKRAPSLLLSRFENFKQPERRAVVETLAARKLYAEALLSALRAKRISRGEISAQVARSLHETFGARFTEIYGRVPEVAEDREKILAKYKRLCNPAAVAAADASRGRAVFQKTCAACHTLYGEGGKVGPDLTGSNRANLDYILLNSVDPSYDVPDAYKTITVLTNDGRIINGVLAEEDATRLVLKTAEQPRAVVAKQDIDVRRTSPKSMMPDGQLDEMEQQEVIDLIKYLRTTEQVEMPR